MLARERRLRRERDIARVYGKGRFGGGLNLQVKVLTTGYSGSRVAIVVSKKVSKSAVVRNRIKRRLAGQIEQLWQTVRPGCDIVVTVRVDVSVIATTALAQDLTVALQRAGGLIQNTKGQNV